mgnify:FL=1
MSKLLRVSHVFCEQTIAQISKRFAQVLKNVFLTKILIYNNKQWRLTNFTIR